MWQFFLLFEIYWNNGVAFGTRLLYDEDTRRVLSIGANYMKVKNSISTTMHTVEENETQDQAVKNIFSYKPIMSNILKYTVEEYKDCSLEEIMECIEGDTIQTGTALVEEDMGQTIRGERTEFYTTGEAPATFDILFRSLLPQKAGNILVNLHVDFEVQKNYKPGYPIIKRGIYYGCRKLSAQLDKIGKNGKGYKYLEKVYSIWICLENIPEKLQNTISYYKMVNYKNEGFQQSDIQVNAKEADLIEVVVVRLGGEVEEEKGLMDLLYGVFSGNQEKVLSYIPDSDNRNYQEEVSEMLDMISYAEEIGERRGAKRAEKQGEMRMGKLVKILLKNKRYADAEKASEDEEYREKLYKEYEL